MAVARDAKPPPRVDVSDVNLGFADVPEVQVQRQLEKLGDPRYAIREAASKALAAFGPGAYRTLSRAYRESDDYEQRVRLEEIVRKGYLWEVLLKRRGFLGITYPQQPYRKLPDGTLAVDITGVQPGSAANAFGLRAGDHLVTLDGRGFTEDAGETPFKDRIQNRGANAKVRIGVIRNGQPLVFEVVLQARPLEYYTQPEMLDDLNRTLQSFGAWRARYFAPPGKPRERTPSSSVLELPE